MKAQEAATIELVGVAVDSGPAESGTAKTSRPSRANLQRATTEVVAKYLGGAWPELEGRSWTALRAFLLNEVFSRRPGFSTRDYRIALTVRLAARRAVPKPRPALAGARVRGR